MFSHSFPNFLHPTVYLHSRFTLLCKCLGFAGFMFMCASEDVSSFHVPPCMCPFLRICAWLQIAESFDAFVCSDVLYVKHNFDLCFSVLFFPLHYSMYVYAFHWSVMYDGFFLAPIGFTNTKTLCIPLISPRPNSCQYRINLGTLPALFQCDCTMRNETHTLV